MRLIFTWVLLSLPFYSFLQNENDLFRYSKTTYQGGARYEAMGGSFGALGADLSCSQINPAGFGRYSSSQVGTGLNYSLSRNRSQFNGTGTNSDKDLFRLPNLSFVIAEDKSTDGKGILYQQFGFGYNRIENYTNTIRYEGQLYNSLLDVYSSQAAGYTPEELSYYFPFTSFLTWQTHAMNYDAGSNSYYTLLSPGDMYHNRTVTTKGGMNEWFLSYSLNYVNKLYFGANLGIRSINFEEKTQHNERLLDTEGTPLRSFDYTYTFQTSGTGSNLKIGAIYLPIDALRIGLAIHSPTFIELKDEWNANMRSNFEDSTSTIQASLIPYGDYKYKVRTPTKITASGAYVFGTKGCINIDLEYIDYASAHFRSTNDPSYAPYDYNYENTVAKSLFQKAVNIRIGGEYVIYSRLFLRGGFGYYPPAFKKSWESELSADKIYSTGLGYRFSRIRIDFAYKLQQKEQNYYAFSESVTYIKTSIHSVIMSCNFSFK
jgi:hypothetical protein